MNYQIVLLTVGIDNLLPSTLPSRLWFRELERYNQYRFSLFARSFNLASQGFKVCCQPVSEHVVSLVDKIDIGKTNLAGGSFKSFARGPILVEYESTRRQSARKYVSSFVSVCDVTVGLNDTLKFNEPVKTVRKGK